MNQEYEIDEQLYYENNNNQQQQQQAIEYEEDGCYEMKEYTQKVESENEEYHTENYEIKKHKKKSKNKSKKKSKKHKYSDNEEEAVVNV